MFAQRRWKRLHRLSLLSLAACAGGLALAAASATPAVPGVPSVPNIPQIPGLEKARFKVVVEGTALAAKDEDWGSTDPNQCSVDINGRLEEKTEYRRGKGVLMEFTRLGSAPGVPILVARAGRTGDSSLAVQATLTRTASGYARRFGSVPEACPPVTEDLASSPECGKPEVKSTKLGLLYERGLLKLSHKALGSVESANDCGASTVRGGMDALVFSWDEGVPAKLNGAPLSPRAIFGRARVLIVRMSSGQKKKGPEKVTLGTLVGTVTEFGRNTATIRLIRVP